MSGNQLLSVSHALGVPDQVSVTAQASVERRRSEARQPMAAARKARPANKVVRLRHGGCKMVVVVLFGGQGKDVRAGVYSGVWFMFGDFVAVLNSNGLGPISLYL